MSNTAALLGSLLCTNADINYYTQQQIFWSNKYEANAAKLSEQTKYYQKWESAFDDAQNTDKLCKIGDRTVKEKGNVLSDDKADEYAHAKVEKYNEELSMELADLDIEYDTMKTMYETLLEKLRADQEGEKTATSTAAQDTGLVNGG